MLRGKIKGKHSSDESVELLLLTWGLCAQEIPLQTRIRTSVFC